MDARNGVLGEPVDVDAVCAVFVDLEWRRHAAVAEQVEDLLVVDLHERAVHERLLRRLALHYGCKDVFDRARDDPSRALLESGAVPRHVRLGAKHRERLAAASLAVRKERGVEAFEERLRALGHALVDLLLRECVVEHCVVAALDRALGRAHFDRLAPVVERVIATSVSK